MWRGKIIIVMLAALCPSTVTGAFERTPADAEAGALAGAGAGRRVAEGRLFANPAQLAWVQGVPFQVTRGSLYGVRSLGWTAAAGGKCLGSGAVCAGLARFGDDGYREITMGASLGFPCGATGVGAGFRVQLAEVMGLGTMWRTVLDLGMLQPVGDSVCLGLVVAGLGAGGDVPENGFAGPRICLGSSIRAGKGIIALVDVEQGTGEPRRIHFAVESSIGAGAVFRVGRVTEPGEVCGGLGLRKGRMGIDISVQWHAVLGFSNRITVAIGLSSP
ncbi:MAG: hypothetical protein KAW17_05815 [Candidatus Eisenbacteria sp.]|nr:hypothetical protein [Candidatus Eisenbacteria bacterium]